MDPHPVIEALELGLDNASQLLESWSRERPLALLHSGRIDEQWARWSIAAEPRGSVTLLAEGCSTEGELPNTLARRLTEARSIRERLDLIADAARLTSPNADDQIPFTTGWIMVLHYELGAALEDAATKRGLDPHAPLATFLWCPDGLVHDRIANQWWRVRRSDHAARPIPIGTAAASSQPIERSPIEDAWPPDAYLAAVAATRAHIEAGDIFQANITRPLQCRYRGDARALALAALRSAEPWYGASIELPGDRHVISLSPELFLTQDADGRLTTRPIKGTRPGSADPQELEDSIKDAAELHMIVDLMRNDLGRVCRFGSIHVREGRRIETHPTVHHGVAEVVGQVREDVSWSEILSATFPPGSITGAPKIMAMRVIESLEPGPRGPYCGAVGFLSSDRRFTLNVGIRTLDLTGTRSADRWDLMDGVITYGTGGGIVADSTPIDEFRETVTKAEVLRRSLDAVQSTAVPSSTRLDQGR